MSRPRISGFAGAVAFLLFALAGCGGGGGGGGGGGSASGGATFSVSGTLSGYAGSGLVLRLRAGGGTMAVGTGSGTFAFSGLSSGSSYQISVATHPSAPAQTCTVASGSGTVANANITNVQINCVTNSYTISGSVSGLTGTGLVLQNGSDNLAISASNFTFGALVADGSPYSVTVLTQPTGQTCTPSSNTGIASANVTNVQVACTNNPLPPPTSFTIGGSISGLTGGGLILRNNGGDNLAFNPASAVTTFAFNTPVASGGSYTVTVFNQPAGQTCAVANGSGINVMANVDNVQVNCTNNFTIGGSVTGLAGAGGLALRNNGGDHLDVSASAFTFATKLPNLAAYNVTVFAQPAGRTCTVSGGGGNVAGANVTSVVVNCVANTFTISGTVSGLNGAGLVLRNNANDLPISANGAFTFSVPVASGNAYSVSVFAQPAGQFCGVANGNGTVASAPITNVQVSCTTNSYTISVSVTGLNGAGLVLQNNLANNLAIGANGTFPFAPAILNGLAYSVTVLTQPAGQTCAVASGSGTVAGADITVPVSCVSNFSVGGLVSNLIGSGLVLQNNGADNLPVSSGSFTFGTLVANGSPYSVTVLAQPVGQTCTVSGGGSGTVTSANVSNVQVTCVDNPKFTIGGTVSGLSGSLTLQNNGTDNLTIGVNGAFAFGTSLLNGAPYAVTVLTQPTGQTCTVTNGSGNVPNTNVTTVQVNCVANPYTIGGSASGLSGAGLVLQNNGADNRAISADGAFTFTTAVPHGSAYGVTVLTQPAGQTCTVAGGDNGTGGGTVAGANVTNVQVTCVSNFSVGGSVSGLVGAGLVLQNNGADNLPIGAGANGVFTFTAVIASGSPYSVTVLTQPAAQTCTVASGSGTVSANVANVQVSCVTNTYTISGNGLSGSGVSGLIAGRTLILQNNLVDNLSITANGAFAFNTAVASGLAYSVTILTQPLGQTCSVTNGSGTVAAVNITNVGVSCVANPYTISGNVSGPPSGLPLPAAFTLSLALNSVASESLVVNAYGPFTFLTPVLSDVSYAVTVLQQPSPWICVPVNGAGIVVGANIIDVQVNCADSVVEDTGTTSPLSFPRSHHSATQIANGKVLIAGGYNAALSNPLTSAATFDPALPGNGGFVDTLGPMGTARASHTATPFAGGVKVLIAGGSDGSAGIATAEIFDSGTGQFTATGSMSTLRTDHAAALLQGDKVLVAGGWAVGGAPTSSAEIFNPAASGGVGAFAATGAMITPRFDHSATPLADGKVLIAGGSDVNHFPLGSAEIFDLAANAGAGGFTATGAMITARRGHTATFLPAHNVVLIVGGQTDSDNPIASVEIFDPVTGTFRSTGSLTVPRRNHTATLLANGKVLITGGYASSNGTALATSETYDPAAGLFTNTGSIGAQRADHTATLIPLNPNKVLIVGGSPDGASVVSTAHLFVPQ